MINLIEIYLINMSFAPPKDKSKQGESRSKKSQDEHGFAKSSENVKDDVSRHSEKDLSDSRQGQSRRSDRETNVIERIMSIEKDLSGVQQQQDMYRQLVSLKQTVDVLLADQKVLHTLVKRTSKLEEKLDDFTLRFDEYQRKTEQFLVVVDKNIDEESALRENENKNMKKVLTELERRQKEMDYEIKKDIKYTQIKAKEELYTMAEDIDKKACAHKEFLENHMNAIHRALKSTLVDDDERINNLSSKLAQLDEKFERKLSKLDEIVMPNFDIANKRRKVDYNDLKAWLLESIDERMKHNEKKLEDTVKSTYKATVLKQNSEINTLKRGLTQLSETSPNVRPARDSTIRKSHLTESQVYGMEELEEAPQEDLQSQGTSKYNEDSNEYQLIETVKELKTSISAVERYSVDSGDDIGNKLDQHKITIYDWNDKIIKTAKSLNGLKSRLKKESKNMKEILLKELKNTSSKFVEEFNDFEAKFKEDLESVKELIENRKEKLVTDVLVIDDKVDQANTLKKKCTRGSPSERDKKAYQLKIEFSKLDASTKHVDQLKKQIESSHSYLNKEVDSLETRLFTTRQMLSRDIETNLD